VILTAYTPFFIEAQLFGEQGVGGSNQPKAGKSSRPDQPFKQFLRGKGEEGGNYMANRNRHTFKKSQKELKRKKKAAEKMARRQGKKNLGKEEEKPEAESDQ